MTTTGEAIKTRFKYQVTIYPTESSSRLEIVVKDMEDGFETAFICASNGIIGSAVWCAVEEHQMKKIKEVNPFAMYRNAGL